MKIKEIREKSSEELSRTIIEFKKESFNLRFQIASGGAVSVSRIKYVRKSVAKIKTILNARKLKLEVANA
jgi:large subunit ribosomal protein L29